MVSVYLCIMITKKPHLSILLIGVMLFTFGCNRETRYYQNAKAMYEEGKALSDSNQSVAAAEAYRQALLAIDECRQDIPDVMRLKGQIEDQLGIRYWKHGLKEEALALHQDAIALFREIPGSVLLMYALQNAGRVSASLHQVEQAKQYYDEAFKLANSLGNKRLVNELLLELGRDVYLEEGEYEKTIEMVSKAMSNGARPDLCQLTLGLAYFSNGNDKLAIEYLNQASQSKKMDIKIPSYQVLYQIYELQKDYPKALQCFEKYHENLRQAQAEQHDEEMQRIKRECDLQIQRDNLQAAHKLKTVYWGLFVVVLLTVLLVTLLLLRQKTLKDKLKGEESQRQLDVAMKKNKVFVTALALSEKITGNTIDFDLREGEWNDYLELIDLVYSDFIKKLLERYPTLTKTDLQICSLTRQGFSNQVVAILMNLQTNSYARRKYRIKQEKMNGAEDDRSFEEIINEI